MSTLNGPRAGLIPIPRVFFLDYLSCVDDDFVWFPKYSGKAFIADEVYEDEAITEEVLESLVGEVVWYERHGTGVGVLMPDNMIIEISPSSRGGSSFYPGSGKIGRARFNTDQERPTSPLTISNLARSADPVVKDAKVDGSTVTFTVHCFETGRELVLSHAASALALIAAAEHHTFDGFKDATSKLGTFLRGQIEERKIGFTNTIFGQLAGGMIVESTIVKIADAKPVDFDTLEDEQLMAALREDPWDTWSIQVVTTDAAWVEHLPDATPFSFGFYHLEEPQPWTGEPLVCTDEHAASTALAAKFPLANQPSERSMDLAMIEDLASSGSPLSDDAWTQLLGQHELFLESGGAGGSWQSLSAAGLPLCIYQGATGPEGEQLVVRLKNIAGKSAATRSLEFADLSGAYAAELDLSGARISGAIAIDSIFDGANFEGAVLKSVDFSGARLKGANFRNADLTGADFECCDLTGADFTGATLDGSRFPGAILEDAIRP